MIKLTEIDINALILTEIDRDFLSLDYSAHCALYFTITSYFTSRYFIFHMLQYINYYPSRFPRGKIKYDKDNK